MLIKKKVSYEVGDDVFFKVLHWKKIIYFVLKGKLNPRFTRPFEVLE